MRLKLRELSRGRRIALAVAIVLVAWLGWQLVTWPRASRLADKPPTTTAFIERYLERERDAGREPALQWRWTPLSRIARSVQAAVLVAEDDRFFAHDGFAREEMKKALDTAWESKELPRGASTITQQVAKNLWLSPSRNPMRKLEEALLTVQLERALPKERILEIYLNVAELGPGIYGVEAASRHYFDKSAASLTSGEAAQLAASLSRPSTWHPGCGRKGYARRVALIESRTRSWGEAALTPPPSTD